MSRRRRSGNIAALVLATVVIAGIAPAAATQPSAGEGTHVDGVYARLWSGEDRALIMVEAGSDEDRLSWAISGLEPGADYRIIGTTDATTCDGGVTADTRTFRQRVAASAAGRSFGLVAGNHIGIDRTHSVRIVGPRGEVWRCGSASRYSRIAIQTAVAAHEPSGITEPPDAALVPFGRRGLALVESLDATTARVTVALRGLERGEDFAVRGRRDACAATPTGSVTFGIMMKDVLVSSFVSRRVELTPEELAELRSLSVESRAGDINDIYVWDCRRPRPVVVS